MDVSPESPAPSIPPLQTVALLQASLSDAGIASVVGGSGLLASLGLIDEIHDWDLVDAGDHSIDVLVGFALEAASAPGSTSGGGVVAVPARAGHSWRGLRMARPQEWIVAYRLIGRAERADALARHLHPDQWSPRQDSNLRHPL